VLQLSAVAQDLRQADDAVAVGIKLGQLLLHVLRQRSERNLHVGVGSAQL
jgi:hypothetical protein